MSSLAIAFPPNRWIDEAIAAREPSSPNVYLPMMGAFAHPAGVQSDGFLANVRASEAQVACDQLIGPLANLGMGADNDAAAAQVLDPPAHRVVIINKEDDEVEAALEVEARALVDDDTWPKDSNVTVRPKQNVVRRAVIEPALRPFRDFDNLHHRDYPGAPPHVPMLGTKRNSERLLARTRCFRLATRMMPFEKSDNEWVPPSFPVSSSTEDEE